MVKETLVQMYMAMTIANFENDNRFLEANERQKLNGRVCSFCAAPLPQKTACRQTYCGHCPPSGAHHVRMDFHFLQRMWLCGFWDVDTGEKFPDQLRFDDAERLYMLARRGRAFIGGGRKIRFTFFNAIGAGRGAVDLTLDDPQYLALREACNRKRRIATATLTWPK